MGGGAPWCSLIFFHAKVKQSNDGFLHTYTRTFMFPKEMLGKRLGATYTWLASYYAPYSPTSFCLAFTSSLRREGTCTLPPPRDSIPRELHSTVVSSLISGDQQAFLPVKSNHNNNNNAWCVACRMHACMLGRFQWGHGEFPRYRTNSIISENATSQSLPCRENFLASHGGILIIQHPEINKEL